jgi:hypothetical protein
MHPTSGGHNVGRLQFGPKLNHACCRLTNVMNEVNYNDKNRFVMFYGPQRSSGAI